MEISIELPWKENIWKENNVNEGQQVENWIHFQCIDTYFLASRSNTCMCHGCQDGSLSPELGQSSGYSCPWERVQGCSKHVTQDLRLVMKKGKYSFSWDSFWFFTTWMHERRLPEGRESELILEGQTALENRGKRHTCLNVASGPLWLEVRVWRRNSGWRGGKEKWGPDNERPQRPFWVTEMIL